MSAEVSNTGGGEAEKTPEDEDQPLDRMYMDLGCGITNMLTEARYFKRENDWRDRDFLVPAKSYQRFLLPPSHLTDQPETGLCVRYLHTSINRIRHPVSAVVWTPDGRRVITASHNGEFTLWSAFGFISDSSIAGHECAVRALKWSKNQNWLVSGDHEGNMKFWSPQLRPVKVLNRAHNNAIRGIAFAPSDNKIATASDDLKIKIWDFPSGGEESVLSGHGFDVKSIDWHPTKALIISGGRDNSCRLWNGRTGKEVVSLSGHKNTVNHCSFNPINGNWFVTASRDKTIKIWDLRMIKHEKCLHTLTAHSSEVYSCAWHPVFESLLVTGGYDGSMLFWSIQGKVNTPQVQASIPAAHEGAIWSLSWNPAGHMLCSGSNDRTCKFWARMQPGSTEDDYYRGYLRDVSEVDVLKSINRAPPPVPKIDHTTEQNLMRQVAVRKRNISKVLFQKSQETDTKEQKQSITQHITNLEIPSIGPIGQQNNMLYLTPEATVVQHHTNTRYNPDPTRSRAIAYTIEKVAHENDSGSNSRRKKPRENFSSSADTELGGGGRGRREGKGERRNKQAPVQDVTQLPGPRSVGHVRMFDEEKGYGFIRPYDGSPDLFAHQTDIENGYGKNGEQKLSKGDDVVYRPEVAINKNTGKEQHKARNIVHISFDPEKAKSIPQKSAPPPQPQQSNAQQQRQEYNTQQQPLPQQNQLPPPMGQIQLQQQPQQHAYVPQIPPDLLQLLIQQANDPVQLANTLAMHNLSAEQLQLAIQQQHFTQPQQMYNQTNQQQYNTMPQQQYNTIQPQEQQHQQQYNQQQYR